MADKKDDKPKKYFFYVSLKEFFKDLTGFIDKLGITKFLLITLILFFGYQALDTYGMISKRTGLPSLRPVNLTEAAPTAELGKYPYHEESKMLVYFYTSGSRTERMPPDTTCWGMRVNDYSTTIATFSTETTITVVNGACTFYSLTEVYDNLTRAYSNINWVTVVDNQVISSP